jgi:hypothetical protein
VPAPPQADARKTPLDDKVVSSLPPASVVIVFSGSSLISIWIFPVLTNFDLAISIMATSIKMIPVNMATPKKIVVFINSDLL